MDEQTGGPKPDKKEQTSVGKPQMNKRRLRGPRIGSPKRTVRAGRHVYDRVKVCLTGMAKLLYEEVPLEMEVSAGWDIK